MASEKIVNISSENWKTEVIESTLPVLVDFWAEWCAPCRAIGPVLDELAEELVGKAKIAKVNVDENQQLAAEFSVRSIPMLLVFKGGAVQETMVGATNKAALQEKLNAHIQPVQTTMKVYSQS